MIFGFLILVVQGQASVVQDSIPERWGAARAEFEALAKAEKKARRKYRQNVDESYEMIVIMRRMISELDLMVEIQNKILPLLDAVNTESADDAMKAIKALGAKIDNLTEMHRVKSRLSKARKALRGDNPDLEKAAAEITRAHQQMQMEIAWHKRAADGLALDLEVYDQVIANTIGMRMQERLTPDQAESIASCLAVHKDLSLHF